MFTLAGTTALSAALAPRALAAPPAPKPSGDDLGFLSFGAVAEGVLAKFYTDAAGVRGAWTHGEKALLKQAHDHHLANVARLNAALGADDAVTLGDFRRVVPVGSRAGALKVGRELETLVAGTYLNGVGYAADEGTRLLLGRLLAAGSGQGALLTRLAGRPLGGLPAPIDLDAAGMRLDAYLKDPSS